MALRFRSLTEMRTILGRSRLDQDVPKARRSLRQDALEALSDTPHDRLWRAVQDIPGVVREYPNAVPGRRYRLDIAIPKARLAIEVDGWAWHGKHKKDFARDRERQNLLTLHGWRILRFTAGQIRRDLEGCIAMIRQAARPNPYLSDKNNDEEVPDV